MTTGQISHRVADLMLALGFGIVFIVNPFLFIAAPGGIEPMFGFGYSLPTGVLLLFGNVGMLIGFALMYRMWRHGRDPEPERFRQWRYRSR